MDYLFNYSYSHNQTTNNNTFQNVMTGKTLFSQVTQLADCITFLDKNKRAEFLKFVDSNGDTALTWLASNPNSVSKIDQLFDAIPLELFDVKNSLEETPLHVAVFYKNQKFLDKLIDKQVDGTIKDNRHLTAFDLCRRMDVGITDKAMEKSFSRLSKITKSDYQPQAFQWGQIKTSSTGGQLGKASPVLFNDLESSISQIAFGQNFSLLLTDVGSVYSWGYCSYGKLGHRVKKDLPAPTRIKDLESKNIKSIACGKDHSVALDDIGCVYVWGNGSNGRLGHGSYEVQPTPIILPYFDGVAIKSIACGSDHTLALASNGKVYSWGATLFGKLGYINEIGSQNTPKIVPNLNPAIEIACGHWHSVVLTKDHNVYTFGSAKDGRLGRSLGSSDTPIPGMVSLDSPVKKIVCGVNFTLALTKSNIVFGWGSNLKGCLNLDRSTFKLFDRPTTLKHLLPYPINNIEVGDHHVLVLTDQGEVLSFGDNEYFQTGLGESLNTQSHFTKVALVDGSNVFKISAGCNSSMMGISSGHQQLGNELSLLLSDERFHDLRLCVEDNYDSYITAHRAIVASRCPILHTLLKMELESPNNNNSVSISQTSKIHSKTVDNIIYLSFSVKYLTTLSLLLRFLYIDQTPLKSENVSELGELAFSLKIERLTYICNFKSSTAKSLDLLPTSSLTDDFKKLSTEEFLNVYHDIELRVHDENPQPKLLKSYKVFLSLRSTYFKMMFTGNFIENEKKTIDLYETSSSGLQLLLNYLYSNEVPSDPTDCIDLIILADLHQLPRAKELCAGVIRQFIDNENICYIYKIGIEYDVRPLIAWCESKISTYKNILKTIPYFDQLSEKAKNTLLDRAGIKSASTITITIK